MSRKLFREGRAVSPAAPTYVNLFEVGFRAGEGAETASDTRLDPVQTS